MTRPSRSVILGSLFFLGVAGVAGYGAKHMPVPPAARAEMWKKVDDAVSKGLPQTAIKELEPILEAALKEKAYPEAILAVSRKIALEGAIQGNKPEERIPRMKAEIAKAPKEMVPVMDAVLGHWYWHYFQQNRWRFLQRTATSAPPGADFTTWDLPRLFSEIDAQFTRALAAGKELKAIPIGAYDALLVKGTMPDSYRPTLWDFIAYDALEFYTSGEQAAAKPSDAFEIAAGSPVFGPVEEFLKWQPATTDADAPKLKAIKLYQAMLAFHADDKDPAARLDADLARLAFGFNVAIGEEKTARYKTALTAFIAANADHELSSAARHALARILYGEGAAVEARELALQGKNAHPTSNGGRQCANLVVEIEAKEATITTERVWNEPRPTIRVQYRNIDEIHFRLVKADWSSRFTKEHYRPENLNEADRKTLLAAKPDRAWSADLPATPDYHARTEDLAAPQDLAPGFYFLFASPDVAFGANNNVISVADIWVSDLAIVLRNEWSRGKLGGLVTNAISGEPIANAKVQSWHRDNNGNRVPGATLATDVNGLFHVEAADRGIILLATHEGQSLGTMNDIYLYKNHAKYVPRPQTILFTDRSLYRPGQTVHFKGIHLLADTEKNDYQVLPNKPIRVVFNDPNGKEIAHDDFISNAYGSISGSFTAPRDHLAGTMTLFVTADNSQVAFNVEEYKRPKFQVTMDAPKEAPKLNGPVVVNGKATGYTGAAVGGAKVRYRVTREVRWPAWFHNYYWWRLPPNPGSAQEMSHGIALTESDGSFSVTFAAKPDLTVPEKDEPTFVYRVTADVTDTTGETRSADRSTTVGYTALQANLAIDAWQTAGRAVKVTIATTSLDGEGQAATGTVKVYKLKTPATVTRPNLLGAPTPNPRRGRMGKVTPVPPTPDPADPRTWDLGEVAASADFITEKDGRKILEFKLEAGLYRAVLETQDRFAKPVSARESIQVVKPDDTKFALKIPHLLAAPKWASEPGAEFTAVWGTGYDKGRAFVEVEHRGKLLQAFWTDAANTQVTIKQAVTEAMRGGFTVRVSYVRENRAYLETHHVDVPWSNKDLTVKWERFVSKLEPAKKETFTAVISGPGATKAVAEMVAALYDASLDAYLPHHWLSRFNVFHNDYSNLQSSFENSAKGLYTIAGQWARPYAPVDIRYRALPADLTANMWGYMMHTRMRGDAYGLGMPGAPAPMAAAPAMPADGRMEKSAMARESIADAAADKRAGEDTPKPPGDRGSGPDLSKVAARKNLNELAFFFPSLTSGADGTVKLEFTMPEALTKWKFMSFAHDTSLRSGYLQDDVVTAKELMVQPNPPRFLREGDVLEFSAKVSNQSAGRQTGKVRLTVADARTLKSVDAAMTNATPEQDFDIPAGESKSFFWRLTVPDGLGPITYTTVGATDRLSDGEEGALPVLSKRILVTESLPLPIRNAGTKTFDFAKLKDSGKSDSIRSQSFTVQMVSQPAWYAVLSLPYLMEYPHECSEQTFNRLYANSLAKHVAGSDPKIRRIFDQWKNTPALDSPLTKNQDLKAVMIEETPWLRDADKESESRRNVGILFDENRLTEETARGLRKLTDMQRDNGMWPWFPGGPDNEYLSLYITTGFGRLRHLGVKIDTAPAIKALARLDAWMTEQHQWILAHSRNPEDNHLGTSIAFYLYGRSFFLADKPVAAEHKTALDYWQRQARNHWLKLANRQSQAHIAIGLKRFGDKETPRGIMASIKERSVTNEEMGRFWRDTEFSASWFHAPVETQAVMIEAFDEVMGDAAAVEDCKVWLLKQKQTRNWKTTKATADAVYALLLRGTNLLASDALVEVKLGDVGVKPEHIEPGTGFYEQKFIRGEVKPEMGKVTVTKTDPGVSWGSVHWQYLEDVSKVTAHEGTPLKLEKALFKKTLTKKGPVIEPLVGPAAVGDEIVVRVVLRTDRDIEYIHLKDQRGSGTEPTNVISQYKFQDGLYYYESTKDTASHFFIDYLPKGVYVFEYSVRIQHRGTYPSGLASVQCMYAPEFNSHSASVLMEVK